MSEYIDVNEAAKILGVHVQTIRNWYRKGILVACKTPATRAGKVLIKRKDLIKLLQKIEPVTNG